MSKASPRDIRLPEMRDTDKLGTQSTAPRFPNTSRKDIVAFLATHEGRHEDDGWHLGWDIRMNGHFDRDRLVSGKHPAFEADEAFDQRWMELVDADKDGALWNEAAEQALFPYLDGFWAPWPGTDETEKCRFSLAGRSNGTLVLDGWEGRSAIGVVWRSHQEFVAELQEMPDTALANLYRIVGTVDRDVANRFNEMAYQYASLRQVKEEEWKAEAAPRP